MNKSTKKKSGDKQTPKKQPSASSFTGRLCYTLLILIAGLLFSSTLQAQTPPDGLHMTKTWTADDPDKGDKGVITLEAYVTGSAITVSTIIPTDIVLVLDMSQSMSSGYLGSVTRVQALHDAVKDFLDVVYNKDVDGAENENVIGHRISMIAFSSQERTSLYSTENEIRWNDVTDINCQESLREITGSDGEINSILYNTAVSRINSGNTVIGTYAQYGLNLAHRVLDTRQTKTFTDSEGREHDRSTIVVFFTDGYPGGSGTQGNFYYPRRTSATTYNQAYEADAAVYEANRIKGLQGTIDTTQRATVYTVGIFDAADPRADYITSYVSSNNNNNYHGYYTQGTAAANGMMHMISSDYEYVVGMQGPNYDNPTGNTNPGYFHQHTTNPENHGSQFFYTDPEGNEHISKYFSASNASQLSSVFTTIANSIASVQVQMDMQTIIQDQISPNFMLPEGANRDSIMVYTYLCTGVDNPSAPTEYYFDTKPSDTLKDAVAIINDLIRITGFDFGEMWCGLVNNDPNQPHGKKIVIQFPLVIQEGVWGDGLPTNGPLSLIFPNGDTLNPIGSFPIPTATVKGDVWTEIVTRKPNSFNENANPIPIGSPEDLAWFISWVNGREGYGPDTLGPTNNIIPHPRANAVLTADLDMSAHNWIPIGSNGITYAGTFDGNGHVITGLKNNASKMYKQGQNIAVYPGMFGKVSGTVHDVFVLDCEFRAKKHDGTFIHYGIIIDTLTQDGVLYNSEAAGRLMTDNEAGNESLILGGLVGLNQGTIHSSMSMAQLTGFTMGGGVGENEHTGTFHNSLVNPVFNYLGAENGKYVGGLIGDNHYGYSHNCYVRFERENQRVNAAIFGMLAGWSPSATMDTHTYGGVPQDPINVPNSIIGDGDHSAWLYNPINAPYLYNTMTNNMISNLNSVVDHHLDDGWSHWKRTTAGAYTMVGGDINDDYPILIFNYPCVASTDGITLDYAANLSDMIKRHNDGKLNENTQLGENYMKNQHEAIYGGTINLYDHQSTDQSTNDNVVIYIDEDVSLIQDNANSRINAYTCQTMKRFTDNGDERWHNISSSLSNSGIGISYSNNGTVPHNWNSNPCGLQLSQEDDLALFPSDAPVSSIDFYCFFEPQYHWLNFKRNSASHWHMDNYSLNIPYTNETTLTPGKGYLLAIDKDQFLQNRGILNNGDVTIDVTCDAPEWTGLKGYNLLGNPYQSYLDFDEFVSNNSDLWVGEDYAHTYAVYDPSKKGYIQYTFGASQGGATASRNINMHQGFFIRVSKGGEAVFNNGMRTNTAGDGFRTGEQPIYPLVNLTLTDDVGNTDVAVLEVDRPENGGGEKLRVGSIKGRISLRHNSEDFAILFRDMTEGSQPLYFDADEDGMFTLSWNTANADFRELTLVDNITGVRYDMLSHDHYVFEGHANDYRSRFKVVIGSFTGLEEEETVTNNFAFFDGSEWVVNGQGRFTVTDMMGRMVYSANLENDQNRVNLNGVAQGMYLMQVSNSDGSRVQKIVVR